MLFYGLKSGNAVEKLLKSNFLYFSCIRIKSKCGAGWDRSNKTLAVKFCTDVRDRNNVSCAEVVLSCCCQGCYIFKLTNIKSKLLIDYVRRAAALQTLSQDN